MFGRGYGSDQIDEEGADTGPSSDRVLFAAGVVAADVTFSRSGTSLVARINGTTDQLTIIDGLWSAINNPGIARDRVEYFDFSDGTRINMNDVQLVLLTGGAGADDILGYTTDDVIDGKAGNDLLSGVSGNDTYLFGLGYGQDVIDENNANGVVGSADRVLFGAGITQGNIHFARSAAGTGNDLVITFDGSTDQLTIRDGLWSDTNNRSLDGDRVEYFDFADGSRLTITTVEAQILVGGSGNETLTGFLSDDVIDGKAGNDLLSGVSGNDTYLFGLGYGQDTIDENNANGVVGSADRVLFGTGITQGNVHFARSSAGTGNDLVITFDGSTDQLTIRDGLWSDTNNRSLDGDRVEYFDFADGSRLTITAIEAQILVGGSANETLTGFLSDDLLDGKDGNDSLFGRDGNDVLIGGAGADVLDGGNGTDTASYATAAAGVTANLTTPASNSGNAAGDTYTSIENLAGSAFADVLTGNTGANVLNGGGGNDTLTGGAGNDTFAFRPGYAIDTITDFSAGAGVADVIELSGFTGVAALADVLGRATQQGADTLIDFGAGDQLLLLNVSKSNLVTDDFRFV